MRHAPPDHLSAAIHQFERFGPPNPTLGFTVASIARHAGVARSSAYRRWETVGAANEDLARSAATHRPGWQRTILDLPADLPIGDALDVATRSPGTDVGITVRAAVTSWPSDAALRRDLAAWELAWSTAFARWLAGHVARSGRRFRPGLTAGHGAIALTALVEGNHLVEARLHPGFTAWPGRQRRALSLSAGLLLDQLTEPADRSGARSGAEADRVVAAPPPLTLSPQPSTARARAAVAQAVWEHVATEPDHEERASVRMVDLSRLARHRGLSARRLHEVWPTGPALNADLIDAVFRRSRSESDQLLGSMYSLGLERPYACYDRLLASALHALITTGLAHAPASHLAFTIAYGHPEVGDRVRSLADGWRATDHRHLLATFAMIGRYRRSDIDVATATRTIHGMVTGLQRLGATHPALLRQTTEWKGHRQPVLSLLASQLVVGLSLQERPTIGSVPRRDAPPVGRSRDRGAPASSTQERAARRPAPGPAAR